VSIVTKRIHGVAYERGGFSANCTELFVCAITRHTRDRYQWVLIGRKNSVSRLESKDAKVGIKSAMENENTDNEYPLLDG